MIAQHLVELVEVVADLFEKLVSGEVVSLVEHVVPHHLCWHDVKDEAAEKAVFS